VLKAATICPRPLQVDLWPFDLESGIRVNCDVGYLCANFSLPRPLCSRLWPNVRDRQTYVRRASSLNAPNLGRGLIINRNWTVDTKGSVTLRRSRTYRRDVTEGRLLWSCRGRGGLCGRGVSGSDSQLQRTCLTSCNEKLMLSSSFNSILKTVKSYTQYKTIT